MSNGIDLARMAALAQPAQQQVAVAFDPGVMANIISDRAILGVAAQIWCAASATGKAMSAEAAARSAFDLFDAVTAETLTWVERRKDSDST